MPTNSRNQSVKETLSFLDLAEPKLVDLFFEHAQYINISAGEHLLMEGQECGILGFVLSGRARVYKLGENGREITLFRVEKGGGCILAASCILNDQPYPAFAIAETDMQAIAVPSDTFKCWVKKYPFWQNFVFQLMNQRITSVITLIEEVAFRRVDSRVAEYLAESVNGTAEIHTTHQKIAADLGTSREVVSRILKDFEHRGWIALSRNSIQVQNVAALTH